jgi:5-methylcytosine-specific restriction protein B
MKKADLDPHQALEQFDREAAKQWAKEAEAERESLVERWPLEKWRTMTLEEYALGGHERWKESFCYQIEFQAGRIGSIKGGSARKLLIYKRANEPGWYFDPQYETEQTAWEAIRRAFLEAFELANKKDFNRIDELEPLKSGSALRTKTIFIYFPDELLPIYSKSHIDHFGRLLGHPITNWGSVAANRELLETVRADDAFTDFSHHEIARFLYWWADPRKSRKIVKIAPGERGRLWDDCLRGGYICVGWEEVGDLSKFGDKEEFRTEFGRRYTSTYSGNQSAVSKKANELWTLTELEPGDLVVANRGTSHILGVGTVQDPSYVWRPERAEYKHTVNVEWDVSVARDIEPVRAWATVTVARLRPDMYKRLMSSTPSGRAGPVVIPADELFVEIAAALSRKGQAILYGPPGTGKTYVARRFAVWWLRQAQGLSDTEAIPDDADLTSVETALSLPRGNMPAGHLTRVTFHPSYSYEDFVEGYKPIESGGRGLDLSLADGTFLRVCEAAQGEPDQHYLILIDEINRGNIPKIFGELITLLEKDKRGLQVTLPSGRPFAVPPNVYLVGTMNTADRSIRLLDAALRRRFAFIELMPDPSTLAGATLGQLDLGAFLEVLNERIASRIGREKQVGHSFFLKDGKPITTPEEFAERFRQDLLPLLQEYAYEDYRDLAHYLGDRLVDADRQNLVKEVMDDPDRLVDSLFDEYQRPILEVQE